MRTIKFYATTLVFYGLILGLFVACSDAEILEPDTQSQDIEELARASEMDVIDVVLGDLVINVFQTQESQNDRSVYNNNLPECVIITAVVQQNQVDITMDFGAVGCLVNGNLIRGQIEISYSRNPQAMELLITYNTVDFFFNNKNVIANRTVLRELSNENGNPQFTHSLDVTVIWPNGLQASRSGEKVREWIEGFGSGVFSDNVFEITGNWNTTFVNGNSHTYEVIIPLRRENICTYFVSGSIEIERTNFGGTLDYGDGTCNNQATFTFNNGTVIAVTLN